MSDFNELNVGPKWYVAHTYTGYENKVKAAIERAVENRNLSHLIFDVKIPVTTSVQIDSKGREKIVEENRIWYRITTGWGLTGYLYEDTVVSEDDVEILLQKESSLSDK